MSAIDVDPARIAKLKSSLSRARPRPEEIQHAWEGMATYCQCDLPSAVVDWAGLWSLILRTDLITDLIDLIRKTSPYDPLVSISPEH